MFKKLSAMLQRQWGRLSTYSGSRRLSKFSLVLLFGLDIYLLVLAYNGLQDVEFAIESPVYPISAGCARMSEEFVPLDAEARANALERFVVDRAGGEHYWAENHGFANEEMLPVCRQIQDTLRAYAGNASLAPMFAEYDRHATRIAKLEDEIGELKASYKSALLEKIADQKREDSILPAEAGKIKNAIASRDAEIVSLRNKRKSLHQAIETSEPVRAYVAFVTALPYPQAFGDARAVYEKQAFWYPIKVLAAQVAFLLPLLAVAIGWNLRALKAQNHVQTLISSHLILVAAIPVFTRTLYFVFNLLPHRLLAAFIAWLAELNLGFLWNYVAMVGGVAGALLLILIAQKTFFSPTRQRSARLRKGLCRDCGEKLEQPGQAWCTFCGAAQTAPCPHCGSHQRMLAYHCGDCGQALSQQ